MSSVKEKAGSRTREEVRGEVESILSTAAGWRLSDREIGKQAGCSNVTVGRIRKRLCGGVRIPSDPHAVVQVPVGSIQPSPENDELYRPVDPRDPEIRKLAQSLTKEGQREPVVVTLDRYIVSGHRRYCAARLARLKTILVRFEQYNRNDGIDRHVRMLREYNRQRDKTNDERLREELVDVDPEEAYAALIDARTSKPMEAESMDLGVGTARSKISDAKWPMAQAVIDLVHANKKYWPLTDRRIHYMLLNDPPLRNAAKPASRYCNDEKSYKDLTDIALRLRVGGFIPMHAIGDETRPVTQWAVCENPREFIKGQLNGFLKGYWRDLMVSQPDHIEIIAEKNTVRPLVEAIAQKYTIPVTTGRGYSSLPPRAEIARRFRDSGKSRLVLIVVSDADPEGMDIATSLGRSMRDDFDIDEEEIRVIKAALTPEQAGELGLIEDATAKLSSSRAKGYIEKYGRHVWELEALPPETLSEMLAEVIDSVIDFEAFNRELEAEKNDAAFLEGARRAAHESMKNLDLSGGDSVEEW